jgi:hypothetical protein
MRMAGDKPDSRCKSLAPLAAACLIYVSKSIWPIIKQN